jgi:hypothetical protein
MAEYYPLLSRAISGLPNSTPESRKLVYDRARKALIGQLRTHQPPVADVDIDRESTALDRAIEQLETELAVKTASPAVSPGPAASRPPSPKVKAPEPVKQPSPPNEVSSPAASRPAVSPPPRLTMPPLSPFKKSAAGTILPPAPSSPKTEAPPASKIEPSFVLAAPVPAAPEPAAPEPVAPEPARPIPPAAEIAAAEAETPEAEAAGAPQAPEAPESVDAASFMRGQIEPQRPFAPQPPRQSGPKRPLWIIPLGVGLVVLLVAIAAYKLRDRPEKLVHAKPADQTTDASKIVQRVGGADKAAAGTDADKTSAPGAPDQRAPQQDQQSRQPANPALAVAGRAALLVEAPGEPNKVKTYLGTVVWRLDNVNDDQNQAVGLAVRADIDLPDDKLKASVIFQKNIDPSLPASHTMKVRFIPESGSATGSVKTINVPQMRLEDSASGEPLDGVTVPIVENSFLAGLSPGNAESANLQLLNSRQWIDIPMVLASGKIAKLTFEKTEAGQRDITEAIAAWSKQ